MKCGVAISAITLSTSAYAQVAKPAEAGGEATMDEVVVTGTLIRGIAPAGSNVIGITSEQVQATGAVTTNDLLANLPQNAAGFNGLVQPGGGFSGANRVVPINRPSLRNLPGSNTSGGALTLVLVDGHRVVGAGLGQVAVDPDVIPPGALERVETITDGGSAIYGSDAIGGVINFITRRHFDGVLVEGRTGFADDYRTYDANFTAGRTFGAGSAYISYNFSTHDALYGRDRDDVRQIDWATGVPTARQCDLPNITTTGGTRSFALPGLVLGTFNACDVTDNQAFYSSDEQHHVLAGFSQSLTDKITLDLRAFYTRRDDEGNSGPLRSTVTIASTNPNYRNLPAPNAGLPQAVSFSFGPALGNATQKNRTLLNTWNVTPSATIELKNDWQFRGLVDYGKSFTKFANDEPFTSRISAAATAGTLNPYDVAATSPALLASLIGTNTGRAWHRFADVRGILDGSLFALPGGDVRLAVGAEYYKTRYQQQTTNTATYVLNPRIAYTQSVKSVFGEVQAPIVGSGNAFTGVQVLNLSVSGRYDKYNDFGNTFNPKVGVTYKPLDWVSLTGNWGKSFSAPSPTDQLGQQAAQSLVLTGQPSNFPNGAVLNPPLVPGQTTYSFVLLRGAVADLKPQTSRNWSFGVKLEPPVVPGLTISTSYYAIRYKNAIASPLNGTDSQVFFRQYPNLVVVDPTAAQLQALAAQVNGGLANLATIPGGARVVAMYDIRARNLGVYNLSGLDFSVNYVHPTDFGSVDASLAGNYQLTLKNQPSPTSAEINLLAVSVPRLRYAATVGANVGKLRAQATLNHTSGFDVIRSAALLQDHVGAFNVVNLFFKYDLDGDGLARHLAFTLNVNNVFDQGPPVLKDRTQPGFASNGGLSIGRLVQVGVSKKF